MQYGFLIDHRRCIGCHACTVACKAENDVPVGSFRTWVKYTEKGAFPTVKRHFAVLRCNHCSKAPCVTICPVNALEKRGDGIVDVHKDVCIGCRACMQACPYDALHLNEDDGNVEKCHFCAHRVERGLEPACVVVCPEQAIVAGDLHDPSSRIASMVSSFPTEVRRPEQNTQPNVHYLGHEPDVLRPGIATRPSTYLWSEVPDTKPELWPDAQGVAPRANLRTVLDVGHKVQWGWAVALYLVTKGIAAGAAMLAPFAAAVGLTGTAARFLPEILALAFTTITTGLLVEDLTRPKKFLALLLRPNTRSWLVKGAWVLIAFSTVSAAIAALFLFGRDALALDLRWPNALLGAGAAGYTAFLFRQCEGRDLWQGPMLLPHLLVQAVLAGGACLLPFAAAKDGGRTLAAVVALAAFVHVLLALIEWKGPHATDNARQGAAFLGVVRWRGLPAMRTSLALALATVASAVVFPPLAPVMALACLFLHEHAFVRAGQLPPLS